MFVAAMIVLAFVPLVYPPFPPLVDLPGHMGRYTVALELHSSRFLSQWYDFHWRPIGNLGVDILVVPLASLVGVENATKLVVMAIPPLAVAGMLWVAREVHGRLPPTVAFALPLAFGHPFLYGFVNFSLSMALAFLAFGLWLRLGRLDRTGLRALLFVPISFIVFFAHIVGWGMLGLMCFSAEAVRQHDRGVGWVRAGFYAAWHAAVLALPMGIILAWRSETSGGKTFHWFDWSRKGEYLLQVLRDRWRGWDTVSAFVVYAVPLLALIVRRLTLSRNLAFSALVVAVTFAALPWVVFGSAYVDMRLVPYMAALLVLAVRFKDDSDPRLASLLAAGGLAFVFARTATTTVSLAIAADQQKAALEALDHVPDGSRVVGLVLGGCRTWPLDRMAHLPGMTIVRRHGFSNDQWKLAGADLLSVNYPAATFYANDPSQMVRLRPCHHQGWYADVAATHIPQGAFDYLWTINMPGIPAEWTRGWSRVWSNGRDSLYSPGRRSTQP